MAKVLVTGADGFIGSHLCEILVSNGHDVRALAQYNSFNSWGWLDDSHLSGRMEVVTGDIRDAFLCDEITKGVDEVYHLAALIAIPYSYRAPQSYVDTNVLGTVNICQGALKNRVKKILQTSTSEVYGTARSVPISETHPLQPQSPYSASKIASDSMAMSYFNSFDLPVVLARPFNTYGPRQSARAVIPSIITQIAAGEKLVKLGAISPTRDFNFVEDTCRGLIALMESPNTIGRTVNIGSGREISVGDTFKLICTIMNQQVELKTDEQRLRPAGSEVERLLCDNSLLKSLTGYSPSVSLEEGLSKTVDWFSNADNLKKYKTGIYNV